jgi:hypothetical protein
MTTDTTTDPPSQPLRVLLRNYYEHDVPVDGVNGDETIPLRIRRFTHAQLREFMEGWSRVENPPHERAIYRKADEAGLDMDEVRRRRIGEMTTEERQAFAAQEAEDTAFNVTFCCEQIRQHVWVSPSAKLVMEDEAGDTKAIKTGADLAAAFGGNVEMLLMLTGVVLAENTLGGQKKRRWRSQRGSNASSSTPPPAVDGTKPDATATSAAPLASASPEDASAAPALTPSIATT